MHAVTLRLPDLDGLGRCLARHRARIAGFVFGAVPQLVLMGMVAALSGGGLSDSPSQRPPVYPVY
ncbi:MAG: hypothetical protein IE927_13625 [Rhodobacterales bacterium]|nr:hypothetical protein [Rhodobacterales bacterium]